ncbi:MAG: cysteine--tRNA ligase [Candidatus Paceibacterota bacterium]|jgi:cysteinyl-tRNA synthetase
MALVFYNTLGRQREEFSKTPNEKIRMYSCGPTVYDFAHLGNLRSFIFADTLFRTLRYFNYLPDWVINITDIDDKTIRAAVSEKKQAANLTDLAIYTQKFLNFFIADLQSLNIETDNIKFIKVSDVIKEIQASIVKLLENDFAYKAEDKCVYFNIEKYQAKFGDYGLLVGKNFLTGKKTGARVKVDEYDKENLNDFALWKARDKNDGNIFWPHPILGDGRPGWHIECSAINKVAFEGQTLDFHTGGIDLIFPHHTNEMAQSRALTGNLLSQFWLHSEHLLINDQKMSKSLGNFYRLSDLQEKNFQPLTFRYFVLQSGYGQILNFTWESLRAAETAYKDLLVKLAWLSSQISGSEGNTVSIIKKEFMSALANNLNTGSALAIVWKVLGNNNISPADKLATILDFDQALGLNLKNAVNLLEITPEARKLMAQRETARIEKNWVKADDIRRQINDLGFEISDTETGPFIYRHIS